MQDADKPVLIYSTFASLTAAEAAGKRLLETRLAACVNIVPGMTSIYRWEGRIEQAPEVVMIIKTRASLTDAVINDVKSNHAYANPALLVVPVLGGSAAYCQWLMAETETLAR